MTSKELYLGIDVGGTKVHGVLADVNGKIVTQMRIPTDIRGGNELVEQLLTVQHELCKEANIKGPLAVGVGLPAAIDPVSKNLSAIPNIANMAGEDFYTKLCEGFGQVVAVENDVNCAALAETWLDSTKPHSLAFIAIGTGIGMGIVYDGRLIQGSRGGAGEIAFLPLGGDIRSETVRSSGSLEARIGGLGWRERYQELGGVSHVDLAALFSNSDVNFQRLLSEQADLMAQAILCVQSILAPDLVVLGGSIGSQPSLLDAIKLRLPYYIEATIAIRRSVLGDTAGALGAAHAANLMTN